MSAQCEHFPQSGMMQDWQILHETRLCFSTLIFSFRLVDDPSDLIGECLFRRVEAAGAPGS